MNLILIGGGSLALEVLSFVSNKQIGGSNASGPVIHTVCSDGAREVDLRRVHPNLNILAKTAMKVFVREGISANGDATMPKFDGNDAVQEDG
jgi:hypothetical protein